MADPNLDALLADVLKSFNVDAQPPPAAQQPEQPGALQPHAPEAGPSGLGMRLPARSRPAPAPLPTASEQPAQDAGQPSTSKPSLAFDPLRKRQPPSATAAAPSTSSSSSPGLAFDPLKRGGGAGPKLPARAPAAPAQPPKLPADVQRLADELVHLVHESGMGASTSAGAGPSAPAGGGPSSSSSSPGVAAGGARAATIEGLMQQTRRTVAQQSKFARGERAPGAGPARPQGEGGQGPLAGLLSALGGGDMGLAGLLGAAGGAAGAGGEDEAGLGMVDMIMRQLLSKDVLYTPLKEISAKYPPWLDATTLPAEEALRYRSQYEAIQAVLRQYDEDPDNFPKLVELIQEMQKHGDPPAAIVEEVGNISPGLFGSGGGEGGEGAGGAGDGLDGLDLDPDDFANMQLPEDMLKDLPPELQKECAIQ